MSVPAFLIRCRVSRPLGTVIVAVLLGLALGACQSDSDDPPGPTTSPPVDDVPDDEPSIDAFELTLSAPDEPLVEGEEALRIAVRVERAIADDDTRLFLSASEPGATDGVDASTGLLARLDNAILGSSDDGSVLSETMLSVSLPIDRLPRMPESRTLVVTLSTPSGETLTAETVIETQPSPRPDIYLLAGQSNMVGSSLAEARRAEPGEPDTPEPRIRQLDVTNNEAKVFTSPDAFTDIDAIAAPDERIVEALDPLHDIRDRGKNTKSGTTIGLGISFAKAALPDTIADIVLVPAAWSDTGFCSRATNRFPGSGWNPRPLDSSSFAGTLLHDRAIARTNLAIAETGGILRGILWHQGEADSDVRECAERYQENLQAMVASLRTNIDVDARGPGARGADADIPFIVGTMSTGNDDRSSTPLAPFNEVKAMVDAAHRTVSSTIAFADVVIADDLTPRNGFPCGQGSCIHFGAEALRELGARYHERLRAVLERR